MGGARGGTEGTWSVERCPGLEHCRDWSRGAGPGPEQGKYGIEGAGARTGGGGGAPCSPSAERRQQQCVQLSTVPGADPQRCKELLLLAAATAGEGPGLRDLSGDPAKVNRRPTITFSISPGMCRITMKL